MTNSNSNEPGRRERNKIDKLLRITAAAKLLLAQKGAAEVTTAEVAKLADVASGTLFLYAKNKGEILLLAQNAEYEEALARGIRDSEGAESLVASLRALWTPIFDCNRKNVENGRAYLREVMFGIPDEANHREAIRLMTATEVQTATLLVKHSHFKPAEAAARAANISAVAFVCLGNPGTIQLESKALLDLFVQQATLAVG